MRTLGINRQPLSFQAQQYLRNLITDGTFQSGERLPSEADLATKLGVSRSTLREALLNLEQEGLIIRRHGVGTFVSPGYGHRLEGGLEVLESIDHIAQRIGLETRMGEVEIEERPATPTELPELGFESPEQVISIARTILVGAHPVAHLLDVVPSEYLHQDDLDQAFTGSVLDVLLNRADLALAYAHTKLAAAAANAALARQLQIKRNAPLLRMEARLYTQAGQIVDYSISHFVPGYFDFHVVRRIAKYNE